MCVCAEDTRFRSVSKTQPNPGSRLYMYTYMQGVGDGVSPNNTTAAACRPVKPRIST